MICRGVVVGAVTRDVIRPMSSLPQPAPKQRI